MFKLIIFYVMINGSNGMFISPIGTIESCRAALKMAPALLAKNGRQILTGACIHVKNIKEVGNVHT